jgi:hypothetical protein
MLARSHRGQWLLSLALFAAILLAFVLAVLLQAPPDILLP